MRKEDIAEAMRQLELNFKQHTEAQFASYTKLLEQYMSSTDHRFGQLHQQVTELSKGKAPSTPTSASQADLGRVGEDGVETPQAHPSASNTSDLAAILKVLKVDVPHFNGQNVHNRVYTIEKFFSMHVVPPGLRLQVVGFHLDDEATSWYQWMDRNGSLITWDKFLVDLQECFGSSIYDDPLGHISKLTQTRCVSQFRVEFEVLMNRISGVSEHMLLNFFLWGLKTEIRRELLITPPQSLNDAMMKAQLFEE